MRKAKILAIVMAGGKGERLYPLTMHRCKPAVPFGGKYRIVDFVLSNLVNSRIFAIYVLVQYFSQSLIEHLRRGWRTGGLFADHFITIVPPQMRKGETWYRGTADAVGQNIHLIFDHEPDLVVVFGADHIYRMDINQMIAFHVEKRADVTVAALSVPLKAARSFGIIEADQNDRIIGFQEKPRQPRPMPRNPDLAYASMGNYIFNTDVLIEALQEDARRDTAHDFGKTIIPALFQNARVYAYDFLSNEIPGIQRYEEQGYWRDVGTIEAYWLAHMDLLGAKPRFDLENPWWPIITDPFSVPPARIFGGLVEDSIIGEGSVLLGAEVRQSVIGRGVRLEEGTYVEKSIIMDFTQVGKGARIRKAIVDRLNTIKEGEEIGFNPDVDASRFHRDPSGIVVIPRGGRYHVARKAA